MMGSVFLMMEHDPMAFTSIEEGRTVPLWHRLNQSSTGSSNTSHPMYKGTREKRERAVW